eukprot:3452789-Pyramimonas_sp.AAC.1
MPVQKRVFVSGAQQTGRGGVIASGPLPLLRPLSPDDRATKAPFLLRGQLTLITKQSLQGGKEHATSKLLLLKVFRNFAELPEFDGPKDQLLDGDRAVVGRVDDGPIGPYPRRSG